MTIKTKINTLALAALLACPGAWATAVAQSGPFQPVSCEPVWPRRLLPGGIALATADFNHDNKPDLAIVSSAGVILLINKTR